MPSGAFRRSLPPLAVALLVVAVSVNALHNPFVYDAHDTVTANRAIDAARIARLEPGRLDARALAGALDRLFDGDRGGPSARLTQPPR